MPNEALAVRNVLIIGIKVVSVWPFLGYILIWSMAPSKGFPRQKWILGRAEGKRFKFDLVGRFWFGASFGPWNGVLWGAPVSPIAPPSLFTPFISKQHTHFCSLSDQKRILHCHDDIIGTDKGLWYSNYVSEKAQPARRNIFRLIVWVAVWNLRVHVREHHLITFSNIKKRRDLELDKYQTDTTVWGLKNNNIIIELFSTQEKRQAISANSTNLKYKVIKAWHLSNEWSILTSTELFNTGLMAWNIFSINCLVNHKVAPNDRKWPPTLRGHYIQNFNIFCLIKGIYSWLVLCIFCDIYNFLFIIKVRWGMVL